MREFLFRGKRKGTGEWVYWDVFGRITTHTGKQHMLIVTSGAHTSYYYHAYQIMEKIDKTSIGQCTSMKDKNGKRIFEGDIVCVDDSVWANNQWEPKQFVCEIVFCEKDARFTGIGKKRPREWLYNWNAKSYEAIGNIFDNPELIGGG